MPADCRNRRYPISLKQVKNGANFIFSLGTCFHYIIGDSLKRIYSIVIHVLSILSHEKMFPFTRSTLQKQESIHSTQYCKWFLMYCISPKWYGTLRLFIHYPYHYN